MFMNHAESQLFQNLTKTLARQAATTPPAAAYALLSDDLDLPQAPATRYAVNHLSISLASQIRRPADGDDPHQMIAAGTAILSAATATAAILAWASFNHPQLTTLEAHIAAFNAEHSLDEDDFNRRSATANVCATTAARLQHQPSPEGVSPPQAAADGLRIIAAHSDAMVRASESQAATGHDLYMHDSHFDAHVSRLWAETMLRCIERTKTF